MCTTRLTCTAGGLRSLVGSAAADKGVGAVAAGSTGWGDDQQVGARGLG
jgi:hypothetical protein